MVRLILLSPLYYIKIIVQICLLYSLLRQVTQCTKYQSLLEFLMGHYKDEPMIKPKGMTKELEAVVGLFYVVVRIRKPDVLT